MVAIRDFLLSKAPNAVGWDICTTTHLFTGQAQHESDTLSPTDRIPWRYISSLWVKKQSFWPLKAILDYIHDNSSCSRTPPRMSDKPVQSLPGGVR
jgi:hypothetical protein